MKLCSVGLLNNHIKILNKTYKTFRTDSVIVIEVQIPQENI